MLKTKVQTKQKGEKGGFLHYKSLRQTVFAKVVVFGFGLGQELVLKGLLEVMMVRDLRLEKGLTLVIAVKGVWG